MDKIDFFVFAFLQRSRGGNAQKPRHIFQFCFFNFFTSLVFKKLFFDTTDRSIFLSICFRAVPAICPLALASSFSKGMPLESFVRCISVVVLSLSMVKISSKSSMWSRRLWRLIPFTFLYSLGVMPNVA